MSFDRPDGGAKEATSPERNPFSHPSIAFSSNFRNATEAPLADRPEYLVHVERTRRCPSSGTVGGHLLTSLKLLLEVHTAYRYNKLIKYKLSL